MADSGYYSINDFPGDGSQTTFEVSFAGGYISRSHVSARVFNNLDKTFVTREFTWVNTYTIRIDSAIPIGYTLRVYRSTPIDKPLVDYSDGALLSEVNLDKANKQAIFAAAEAVDAFGTVPGNDALRDATAALVFARDRSNHTGTQAISTIAGLAAALLDGASKSALAASTGASLIGYGFGNGVVKDYLDETIWVRRFGAIADNATPCADAINAAIRRVCQLGGGEVVFGGNGTTFYVEKPIFLPSNVTLDLNGKTLRGNATNDLIQSGWWNGTTVLSNIADGDEVNIVQNARVINGTIIDSRRAFNLKNFNQETAIENIKTRNCAQVGYYKRCFSTSLINVSARGGSSATIPTHDFDGQTNSVTLDRVKCVTEWPMRFRGGANVVDMYGCEFEGGSKAIVLIGDCLNMSIRNNYFEAVSGAGIDVSAAGSCSFNIQGNYFNQVGDAFKHGTTSTATLKGSWAEDNELVNTVGGAFPIMRIVGPRNFVQWALPAANDAVLALPSNWLVDKSTRITRHQFWNADALSDVRAVAVTRGAGIIPRNYGGDVGMPFNGSIPFQTTAVPTGASVVGTVTTGITLENNASVVHFIIAINDATGPKKVSGTIYGDYVDQRQGTDRPVTISQTGQGKLVLSIGAINNNAGAVALTGTVFQV